MRVIIENYSRVPLPVAVLMVFLRIDGYKQLREEKKLIWHGRLQGTLLADALENDFMEVV